MPREQPGGRRLRRRRDIARGSRDPTASTPAGALHPTRRIAESPRLRGRSEAFLPPLDRSGRTITSLHLRTAQLRLLPCPAARRAAAGAASGRGYTGAWAAGPAQLGPVCLDAERVLMRTSPGREACVRRAGQESRSHHRRSRAPVEPMPSPRVVVLGGSRPGRG